MISLLAKNILYLLFPEFSENYNLYEKKEFYIGPVHTQDINLYFSVLN